MDKAKTEKLRPVRGLLLAAAAVVPTAHGLVHLMGVALLWHVGQPGNLRYADVTPAAGSVGALVVGAAWLGATVAFVGTAALLATGRPWRGAALGAALLSAAVLLPSAHLAVAGLVVDGVVLAAVATLPLLQVRR